MSDTPPGFSVAIIGMAWPGWTGHGVLDSSQWDEVWGLNGAHLVSGLHRRLDGGFRADRWFQIHPMECCDQSEHDWMRALAVGEVPPVPTYVRAEDLLKWAQRYPGVAPHLRVYPDLPMSKAGWLANTFCLEIVLALSLNVTRLGVFGCECRAYGRELVVERPGMAFWLGIAAGQGVRLELAHYDESTLVPYPFKYGLDYFEEARYAATITQAVLPAHADLNAENLDTIAAVDAAWGRVH